MESFKVFLLFACFICIVSSVSGQKKVRLPLSIIKQKNIPSSTKRSVIQVKNPTQQGNKVSVKDTVPSNHIQPDSIPIQKNTTDTQAILSPQKQKSVDTVKTATYKQPLADTQKIGIVTVQNMGIKPNNILSTDSIPPIAISPLPNSNPDNNGKAVLDGDTLNFIHYDDPVKNLSPDKDKNLANNIPDKIIFEQPKSSLPEHLTTSSSMLVSEDIQKYQKSRRYVTAYVGLGYNMSLMDVLAGVRLYTFPAVPIYFEIGAFFSYFLIHRFREPIGVYRISSSINIGYTYELSNLWNGVGFSASVGVTGYHENYQFLTDVGYKAIINDQRWAKFAWNWAVDATFSIDRKQRYRLMLKHQMLYLTRSDFGSRVQSISVSFLFRLDYKKIQEKQKFETLYLGN